MIRLCFVCCMLVLPSVAQDTPSTGSWLNPRLPIPRPKQFERLNQFAGQAATPATPTLTPEETADKAPVRCAHMITFVPPKDLDKSMVIVPGGRQPSMKVTPPMPVCPEDVRQLPELNKK
jgi:hypothetical protein